MSNSSAIPLYTALERRTATRFPCRVTIVCELQGMPDELFDALVFNLSTNGLAVISPRPLDRGMTLNLIVRGIAAPEDSCNRLARVIHSRVRPCGWIAGCEFLKPLTRQQVDRLRSAPNQQDEGVTGLQGAQVPREVAH